MSETRMILVEGLAGSGKSATALYVEQQLRAAGRKARAFLSTDFDNPIRTRASDAIITKAPGVIDARTGNKPAGALPEGLNADSSVADTAVYDIEQWRTLAERCEHANEIAVLESRYWQDTLLPHVLDGFPRYEITTAFDSIQSRLETVEPLLIYLRVSDPRALAERMAQSSDQAFLAWKVKTVENSMWARSKRSSGTEALAQLNEAHLELADRLFDRHNGPKLKLDDPQTDWTKAHENLRQTIL